MATAIEKIEKIENVHDDGTSTRLSEQAASSRDSESTMDNGKARLERCGRLVGRKNSPSSHENVNEYESDCLPSSLVRDQIIDNNTAVSIEPQLTETLRAMYARHYQEPLKRAIKIQS